MQTINYDYEGYDNVRMNVVLNVLDEEGIIALSSLNDNDVLRLITHARGMNDVAHKFLTISEEQNQLFVPEVRDIIELMVKVSHCFMHPDEPYEDELTNSRLIEALGELERISKGFQAYGEIVEEARKKDEDVENFATFLAEHIVSAIMQNENTNDECDVEGTADDAVEGSESAEASEDVQEAPEVAQTALDEDIDASEDVSEEADIDESVAGDDNSQSVEMEDGVVKIETTLDDPAQEDTAEVPVEKIIKYLAEGDIKSAEEASPTPLFDKSRERSWSALRGFTDLALYGNKFSTNEEKTNEEE